MNTPYFVRLGAVGAAASVAMLAAGPALAAAPAPVAQASANALSLSIGGQNPLAGTPLSSTYSVQTDGSNETSTGNKNPALTVAGPLKLVGVGTAAQDAKTSVNTTSTGFDGVSDACAGLAGPGASIAAVGNAGSCLTGGSALKLSPATLNLTGLDLNTLLTSGNTSLLDAILTPTVVNQLQNLLSPVESQLSGALQTVLAQLQLGLDLKLGAVTAQCHAVPGTATGTSSLANAGLTVTLPSIGEVTLVNLPVNPAPNTHVLTNLDAVVKALETALQTELNSLLPQYLSSVTGLTNSLLTQVLNAVNTNLISVIAPQLKPLQDNLIDITLNKQSGIGTDHIDVTALDLQLLPAAQQFIGSSLVSLQIGHVTCGPNRHVDVVPPVTPKAIPAHITHKVPHKVTSGLGSKPDQGSSQIATYSALAGMGALATGAGILGYRRRRSIKG